jgi:hypothetical protein
MYRLPLAVLAAMTVIAGCSGNNGTSVAPIRGNAGGAVGPNATPTAAASPTPSAAGSATPTAAATATPTPTAAPTATPAPTPTPTPTPIVACGANSLPSSGPLFYATSYNNIGDDSVLAGAGDFSGTPTNAFAGGMALNQPVAAALDSTGKVYIANFAASASGGSPSIQMYPPGIGCAGPLATLIGTSTTLQGPASVAVDSAGYVYVANTPTSFSLFAPFTSGTLNVAPLTTVTLPVTSYNGSYNNTLTLALDSAGRIYVASEEDNEVLVLPARSGTAISTTPVATIVGAATLLDSPRGVALDSSGKIYVTNEFGSSITVYSANPSGTTGAAPIAEIAGASTGLTSPTSVAVDRNGEIYVAEIPGGILEFPPSPSGVVNEAPAGSFAGGPVPNGGDFYAAFGVAAH